MYTLALATFQITLLAEGCQRSAIETKTPFIHLEWCSQKNKRAHSHGQVAPSKRQWHSANVIVVSTTKKNEF